MNYKTVDDKNGVFELPGLIIARSMKFRYDFFPSTWGHKFSGSL